MEDRSSVSVSGLLRRPRGCAVLPRPLHRETTVRQLARSPRLRRTVVASTGTLGGSAAGALLPFLIARWFEVGRSTDVYFLVVGAVQVVGYLLSLVVESAALPFATKAAELDQRSLRPFCVVLGRYVLAAAGALTVLALGIVVLVLIPAAGLTGSARDNAYQLVLAVAALPVLAALSGMVSASNFALDRFALTTGSQVLRAGGGIAMAATLGHELGLLAVAIGLTLGEAARGLLLAVALPRSRPHTAAPANIGLQMLRLASPTLMASIVIAVNPIVDKAVAARLDAGATTLLELGEKLFYIPMVLLVAAVTKVSATVWARQVDVDDDALRRDFWKVQRLGALVTTVAVAVAVSAALLSRDLVDDLLDLGGDPIFFVVFAAYIVGLPLALSADLAGTMLITLRRTTAFPALAVLLVLVNLAADIVGARLFGVVGIAASTTLVRVVNVGVFLWLCDRHLRRRTAKSPAPDPAPAAP